MAHHPAPGTHPLIRAVVQGIPYYGSAFFTDMPEDREMPSFEEGDRFRICFKYSPGGYLRKVILERFFGYGWPGAGHRLNPLLGVRLVFVVVEYPHIFFCCEKP
jgi:hypothetical protein